VIILSIAVDAKDSVDDRGSVTQSDILASIASGVRWVRFAPNLERVFEAETGALRSRQLMIGLIPALLLF